MLQNKYSKYYVIVERLSQECSKRSTNILTTIFLENDINFYSNSKFEQGICSIKTCDFQDRRNIYQSPLPPSGFFFSKQGKSVRLLGQRPNCPGLAMALAVLFVFCFFRGAIFFFCMRQKIELVKYVFEKIQVSPVLPNLGKKILVRKIL